jgi:hypothetical protein
VWKIWAEVRSGLLMSRINEKSDRSVKVADPHFGCTRIKVESAFLVHLRSCVGWGEDLNADLGRSRKDKRLFRNLWSARRQPRDVDGLDAAGGRDRALRRDQALWERVGQKRSDRKLTTRMRKAGRGRHEDMSVLVGLHSVRELDELRIGKNLGPTSQVKLGLRSEVWQLDGNRHELQQSMK